MDCFAVYELKTTSVSSKYKTDGNAGPFFTSMLKKETLLFIAAGRCEISPRVLK